MVIIDEKELERHAIKDGEIDPEKHSPKRAGRLRIAERTMSCPFTLVQDVPMYGDRLIDIPVSDMDRARRFYAENLQLEDRGSTTYMGDPAYKFAIPNMPPTLRLHASKSWSSMSRRVLVTFYSDWDIKLGTGLSSMRLGDVVVSKEKRNMNTYAVYRFEDSEKNLLEAIALDTSIT